MIISLRKKPSFEDLLKENRNQILSDEQLLEKIEERIEARKEITNRKAT
ncbi:FbpB family small basic protein [Terrihalobacillus insolitus]